MRKSIFLVGPFLILVLLQEDEDDPLAALTLHGWRSAYRPLRNFPGGLILFNIQPF